jgi:hypothetical protein
MELGINWYFVISLFFLAITPWILKRSGIRIFFDSRIYSLSDTIHAFTSILASAIFVVNSEIGRGNGQTKYQTKTPLLLLILTIFAYLLIFLMFRSIYQEDRLQRSIDQLSFLRNEKKIAIEFKKIFDSEKQKELNSLLWYFVRYKFLLLLSTCLYGAFYCQLAIILVNAGKNSLTVV